MLIMAVVRYRAAVHPLKSNIGRRKLKIVCGLVHFLSLKKGYGAVIQLCIMKQTCAGIVYDKFYTIYVLLPFAPISLDECLF